MTYENRYSVKSIPNKADQESLTLYEAAKIIANLARSGSIDDCTRITRESGSYSEFVGFFCTWEKRVKAAFQSTTQEKHLIDTWLVS